MVPCLPHVLKHSWEGERHNVAEQNTDFQFGSKKPLGQADLGTAMCNSMEPGNHQPFSFLWESGTTNLQHILNLSISPYSNRNNTLQINSLTEANKNVFRTFFKGPGVQLITGERNSMLLFLGLQWFNHYFQIQQIPNMASLNSNEPLRVTKIIMIKELPYEKATKQLSTILCCLNTWTEHVKRHKSYQWAKLSQCAL